MSYTRTTRRSRRAAEARRIAATHAFTPITPKNHDGVWCERRLVDMRRQPIDRRMRRIMPCRAYYCLFAKSAFGRTERLA